MKADRCMICGGEAKAYTAVDKVSGKTVYGMACPEDHYISPVFETKNRAVKAWNECQGFVDRYTSEEA